MTGFININNIAKIRYVSNFKPGEYMAGTKNPELIETHNENKARQL